MLHGRLVSYNPHATAHPTTLTPVGSRQTKTNVSRRNLLVLVARRLNPGRLIAYPVSPRVNRPANDDPSLIEEAEG